jgi:ATP-binding cassette subfamily F protein 3
MVQSRVKQLAKYQRLDRLERIKMLDFCFNHSPFPARVMLRAQDISFHYDDGAPILTEFDLEVQKHDRICVMGQNGKGKSTLLRLLARELTPVDGKIAPHPKLKFGYFAQTNVSSLSPNNNVVEEIMSAGPGCLPQEARNIAGAMMFEEDDGLKKVSVLSGGEKSRLMLGKVLVSPCNLLLLDEPTNHLDMDSCDSLLAAIDAFDGAVIIVTHNEMFLRTLATRFVVFDRGKIVEYSRNYQDFLDEVGWEMDETLRRKDDVDTPAASPVSAPSPAPAMDKKSLRRARAKILQERSKVAGPLEKKVKELESTIERLEAEAASVLEEFHKASVAGEGAAIAEYSRQNERIKAEIDARFNELDSATREYEDVAKEFDDRLNEFS